MRPAMEDLFPSTATTFDDITEVWKSRQRRKNPGSELLETTLKQVDVIASQILRDNFAEDALPAVVDETQRCLFQFYAAQATSGLLSLRVRVALDACLKRTTPGIPDRELLTEQIRRLQIVSSRYARPKESARI